MYNTNIPCQSAGVFNGFLVVSMRPFTPKDTVRAIEVSISNRSICDYLNHTLSAIFTICVLLSSDNITISTGTWGTGACGKSLRNRNCRY